MKGKVLRKALEAALALLIVSGGVPITPLSQVFEDIAITASAEETTVDLSSLTGNYTAQDGDVLTGSTSGTVTIAGNANITLNNATINGGIICEGSATITLVGTNSVTGASQKAGIQVGGSGTTLTIKGNGSLTANGANNSAGIGLSRAWKVDATGGDIVIESGNITATGKGMGAGIGTGVSFGDDANHTATIGNITIKGGTVTAIGGTNQYFPGSGIGKGGAYSYGNTVVGTVTITTDIDLVDASSISEIVTYKHGETDVTSIASDYFTINEDGNRRIIVPKDDIDYNVTIDEEITGGTVTADKTTAKAGELVTLTITPASGHVLQSLTVKDASDNDVSLSNREFVMPRGGVTVSATFIQTTAAFDEATGVLTLNGNVDADEVKAYGAIIGDYGAIVKESPVTSVVCEPGTVLPADCSELFLNYTNLITIDLSNADISGVTNMSKMFGSRSLTTIYVNSAWSMENVTSSDQMFYGCNLLRGGNGSRWEDVRVAVWESNGNDLEAAKAKASRSSYAIIDGKGGLPGYLTVKPKQTPSAPTANVITYTGEAQELVTAGDGTMLYSLDDGIYSAEIPTATAAGTYTVHYKVDGSDNWNAVIAQTVEVTIAKATPIVTAPTANTLTYNGNEQELVTAGSTDFGTVLYSLDGTNYSEEVPKGTNAGKYTVYYKVEGNDNWNAVEPQTVTAKIGYSDGIGEHLMGYSVSLDGDIGVNFYMELDDSVVADADAYMQFTLPNGDMPKVYVKDVKNSTVNIEGKTYYVFKCNVAAKEMTDTITAQMIDGEKSGTEYTYSVKDYADYLLTNTEENEEYEKAAPLVKAMLDYGAYSQIYFKHNTDALANGGKDSTNIQNVKADTINKPYDPEGTYLENAGDTTFEGATLSLRSETTLSLYFKSSTDLNFEIILDGISCEVEKDTTAGGYQIARIRGIKAADLDKTFGLDIDDAAETGTIRTFHGSVEYCPLTYCYNVLNGGSDDENLQNVCRALYLYWQAAKAYSE